MTDRKIQTERQTQTDMGEEGEIHGENKAQNTRLQKLFSRPEAIRDSKPPGRHRQKDRKRDR